MKLDRNAKVYVAGDKGMVGSALVRRVQSEGFTRILTADLEALDLRDQAAARSWFEENRPEYVFLAAAKVGGILANSTYPAEFIYDNLAIQTNVIDWSYRSGVK
ncbi:MAG: NAD-dependent epimerase/dehydratase family protein, partial [Acidobacteriota bacterium]